MAAPARKYDPTTGSYQTTPANDNRRPRPRLVADNPPTSPSTDEVFRQEQYGHKIPTSQPSPNTQTTSEANVARGINNVQVETRPTTPRTTPPKPLTVVVPKKKVLATLRAIATTASIYSWAFWFWILQLFCAFISITGIVLVAYIEDSTWASIVDTFTNISGAGLAFFFVGYLIALVVGWVTMMVIVLKYTLAFLHPLSGSASSTKWMVFLAVLIGYATPITNLVPWFVVYTGVVVRHPK